MDAQIARATIQDHIEEMPSTPAEPAQPSLASFIVQGGDPSLPALYTREDRYVSKLAQPKILPTRRRVITCIDEYKARTSAPPRDVPEQPVESKVINNFDDSDCSIAEHESDQE